MIWTETWDKFSDIGSAVDCIVCSSRLYYSGLVKHGRIQLILTGLLQKCWVFVIDW